MKLTSILWEKIDKRKVALAVLVYDNKILIVKRSKGSHSHAGKWGFPGGGIDDGETALEAIMRECEEEIGVEPVKLGLLARNKRLTWFKGKLPSSPAKCVRLNFEHDDWAMVGLKDIHNYDMIDGMEEMIRYVVSR